MSRTSMKGFVYRQYTSDGLFVADYKSSREASEKVGTSANSVGARRSRRAENRGRIYLEKGSGGYAPGGD